jgi:hypothetical protein
MDYLAEVFYFKSPKRRRLSSVWFLRRDTAKFWRQLPWGKAQARLFSRTINGQAICARTPIV